MKTNRLTWVVLGSMVAGCEIYTPVFQDKHPPSECTGKPEGFPLAQQTTGDCMVQVCDGQGNARTDQSPEDVVDDGNPCTLDECRGKESVHLPNEGAMCDLMGVSACVAGVCRASQCTLENVPEGTALEEQVVGDCRKKQCDGMGGVTEVSDDDDSGATLECSATWCDSGVKQAQAYGFGTPCGPGLASSCNNDGACVTWCSGAIGFPGEAVQFVGDHRNGMATGDINNDGKLDLVFVDYNTFRLRVLRGLGNGKFDAPVIYSSVRYPGSVELADLDGDTDLDLAVSEFIGAQNDSPGGVRIYYNMDLNSGAFVEGSYYETGFGTRDVAAADIDGDGKVDLIAANYNAASISILRNQGAGTFGEKVDIAVKQGPYSIIAADLDGEGGVDLAVAQVGGYGVTVLLNQAGSFPEATFFDTAAPLVSVSAADVNGDSQLDLMVATYTHGSVGVMKNVGSGQFAAPVKYSTGQQVNSVTTADVNADGRLDIVSTNYTDGTVSVLHNKGDGTFLKATNYATGNNVTEVVAADFTDDGSPDIVASNGTGYLRMLENQGDGTFRDFPSATAYYKTGNRPTSIAARDFNGDQVPDLAVTNLNDGNVTLLLNSGNGEVFSTVKVGNTNTLAKPTTIVSEDFNGDKLPDWAVSESGNGKVAVFFNQGNGIFLNTPVEFDSGEANADAVATADVNGDGLFDLLVAHGNGLGGGTLGVLLNDGQGSFMPSQKMLAGDAMAGTGRATLGVADLNGDDKPDVVMGRVDSTAMHLLLNDGSGSFTYASSTDAIFNISSVAVADLDGDSWRDVVINRAMIRKNTGGPTPQFPLWTYYSANDGAIAIADLNGDNKPDLAQANSTTAELTIFYHNGKDGFLFGTNAPHYAAGVHESYNGSIAAADLNLDGRPDLAIIDDDGVRIYLNTCLP